MFSKVSIVILKQLLCFHCLTKLILFIKPYVIFISLLFRILQSLNHIQLPLFMLITLSIALLRRFLCFHCLTKLVICLNPYFIFISIIFRIVDSLNHIQLPLFMLITLSIALLRRLLCFHCLTRLEICFKSLFYLHINII